MLVFIHQPVTKSPSNYVTVSSKNAPLSWRLRLFRRDISILHFVADNNCVWTICKLKREDRNKMGGLREESGKKKPLRVKFVGSTLQWTGHCGGQDTAVDRTLQWTGHIQRMTEERLKRERGKQKKVVEGEEQDWK